MIQVVLKNRANGEIWRYKTDIITFLGIMLVKTNQMSTKKEEKYLRISRHIAVIFIPVFSFIFVIMFFGIGLIQTSLNK